MNRCVSVRRKAAQALIPLNRGWFLMLDRTILLEANQANEPMAQVCQLMPPVKRKMNQMKERGFFQVILNH